ncbi:MAG: terminase large subunit [Mesorhizobium sp.]|nr:terminase large subunit [Mesorhizobium sp.]
MDTAWAPAETWSTAVPDWKERIRHGLSLIPDLPLFDEVADKALRIFKRLKVPDIIGNPTYGEACDDWVFDFVRVVFGSYDPETKRRMLREFFLLVPKKNGKSSIAAAIIVTAAILNERPEAELLLIAPTKTIADISFKQAAGIIRLDPELSALFHLQDHLKKITNLRTLAVILVKAAAADVITGSKATFILIDETHVFAAMAKASDIFVEIRGSLAARPDGFLLQISTQSKKPPAGVFKAELQKARDVRDGSFAFPMLAVLYELPAEDAVDGGWMRPETWGLVNPNLNRSVSADYLAGEIATAQREGPEKLAVIASQHFNVEIGLGLQAEGWGGAEFWQSRADRTLTLEALIARSEVAVFGADGGGLDDLFGVCVIGREKVTRRWLVWCHAFAHPKVLERRKEIAPQLRDFEAERSLTFCEVTEYVTRIAAIAARLRDAGLLPEKNAVGFDPNNIAAFVDALALQNIDGAMLHRLRQGPALSPALWGLEHKLSDDTISHDGSGLMAWSVGNVKIEVKGNGNMATKQAAGRAKIDPVIAMLCAAILMSWNPEAAANLNDFLANPLMVA